jgi:hypothetical protein
MRLINCDPIALTGRPPIGGLRRQTFHHGAGVGAGERSPAPVRRAHAQLALAAPASAPIGG